MATLLFQGHASCRITTRAGAVIYIDPFAGEGYDLPADLVLITHEHGDHNDLSKVTMKPDGVVIRSADALAFMTHIFNSNLAFLPFFKHKRLLPILPNT